MWVARPSFNGSVDDQLVRITPAGAITGFGAAAGLPDDATLRQIAVGPDGNLYVTDTGQGSVGPDVASRIWRFDLTSNTFQLVATAGTTPGFTAGNGPNDLALGADGNLWFLFGGSSAGVARLTTAGAVTEFTGTVNPEAFLQHLTAACDGGLWITQSAEDVPEGGLIWRAGTDGSLTPYTQGLPAGANPEGIASGPDDDVWFADPSDPGTIGRVGTGCAAPAPPAPPAPVTVTPAFTG
jgi:streptogramin lyase